MSLSPGPPSLHPLSLFPPLLSPVYPSLSQLLMMRRRQADRQTGRVRYLGTVGSERVCLEGAVGKNHGHLLPCYWRSPDNTDKLHPPLTNGESWRTYRDPIRKENLSVSVCITVSASLTACLSEIIMVKRFNLDIHINIIVNHISTVPENASLATHTLSN